MAKKIGVLAPVSILPGSHGIGDFGSVSFEFIDLLANNNISVWQVLPLNPLGYGNSPYQPYSSYAGEELYISLDELKQLGLLSDIKNYDLNNNVTEYEKVRIFKNEYLNIAYNNINKNSNLLGEFNKFKQEVKWLNNYAIFITLKKENNLACWIEWEAKQKQYLNNQFDLKKYEAKIDYEKFVQYIFYKQWFKLKQYANDKKISIMGDIPIYVGIDSCDVWENQEGFLLDDDGNPTFIAGVPPDYFSETGQRWGNPIYDWEYQKKTDFEFWINRLKWNDLMYDVIRIDHFRAFDTYWKIPASCTTAIDGEWVEAPGYELFDEIYRQLPNINIVVEDLGLLRPEVLELRDFYKLAGMKIIQFELRPNEEESIVDYQKNTIIYTGTHDNQTLVGWFSELNTQEQLNLSKQYDCEIDEVVLEIIKQCLNFNNELTVLPVQDILGLGTNARFNTPGTVGAPNWLWKMESFDELYKKIISFKSLVKSIKS